MTLIETGKGYHFTLPLSCADSAFSFAGAIYPGTYRVTVQGLSTGFYRYSSLPLRPYLADMALTLTGDVTGSGRVYSSLPLQPYLADAALAVTSDVNGKNLDVKTVQFGGQVTLNGAAPANGPDCPSRLAAAKAQVLLTETAKGYAYTLAMSCSDSSFTFLEAVYSGTYRVTVQGLAESDYIYLQQPAHSALCFRVRAGNCR